MGPSQQKLGNLDTSIIGDKYISMLCRYAIFPDSNACKVTACPYFGNALALGLYAM
jgi:hypothetical protein